MAGPRGLEPRISGFAGLRSVCFSVLILTRLRARWSAFFAFSPYKVSSYATRYQKLDCCACASLRENLCVIRLFRYRGGLGVTASCEKDFLVKRLRPRPLPLPRPRPRREGSISLRVLPISMKSLVDSRSCMSRALRAIS